MIVAPPTHTYNVEDASESRNRHEEENRNRRGEAVMGRREVKCPEPSFPLHRIQNTDFVLKAGQREDQALCLPLLALLRRTPALTWGGGE